MSVSPQVHERFSKPRNRGPLADADGHARITGACNDTMEMWVRVRAGEVVQAGFETDGCGPSLAAGSMATELAVGRTLGQAKQLDDAAVLGALGGLPVGHEHCATLAAMTLRAAVGAYELGLGKSLARLSQAAAPAPLQARGREAAPDVQPAPEALAEVANILLLASAKGGVGKSTCAVHLAAALARRGQAVGLLDADLNNPAVPGLLGARDLHIAMEDGCMLPPSVGGLPVLSMGFVCGRDEPVIWRGPIRGGVMREFLGNARWGRLDWLVVDCPAGTGDELITLCESLDARARALVVSTGDEMALDGAGRCVEFCRRHKVAVEGLLLNRARPEGDGAAERAARWGLRLAGRVPELGAAFVAPSRAPQLPEAGAMGVVMDLVAAALVAP